MFDTHVNRRAIRSGVAVVVAGLFVVEGVRAAPAGPPPAGPKPRLVAHAFAHGNAFVAARSFTRGLEATLATPVQAAELLHSPIGASAPDACNPHDARERRL